ncbi:hypothetical protein BC835DRAFT_1439222 [Cytidiella melzeri]|nr:hypothetical protein BC835DRAFT_1439222 [Cytidiella melzeri]
MSIKAVLETLTQWSQEKKTENNVSDIYVTLGNDFNAAVSAFGTFRIDMTELNSIPDELRAMLESCLAEDACQQTLDLYLPDVRKIITKLLQGLRAKQSIYRQIVSDQKHRSFKITHPLRFPLRHCNQHIGGHNTPRLVSEQ